MSPTIPSSGPPTPEILDLVSNGSFEEEQSNVTCSNEYCVSDEEYLAMIEEYIRPSALEWALISLHALVFVVGLVGNALVCVSVYRNHSMRTVTNCFIVNLAAADFLVILFCLPPTVLWDVTETWFLGSLMCKIVLYLQSVSVSVSVLTLTYISVDRWNAICRPLSFKSTSSKAAIGLIWVASGALVLPELLYLDTRQHHVYLRDTVYLTDCAYTWPDGHTRAYQLFLLVSLYVAPFLLMAAAYYQIARVLWNTDIPGARETRHFPRTVTVTSSTNQRNGGGAAVRLIRPSCETQIQARRKAAKMLIAVVIIFGICYLPVHLINLLRYTVGLPQTKVTTFFSLISHWLCYANSSINPIIYNFMNAKFRREFRNFLCCWCCRRKSRLSRHDENNTTATRYRFTTSLTQMENINLNTIDRT